MGVPVNGAEAEFRFRTDPGFAANVDALVAEATAGYEGGLGFAEIACHNLLLWGDAFLTSAGLLYPPCVSVVMGVPEEVDPGVRTWYSWTPPGLEGTRRFEGGDVLHLSWREPTEARGHTMVTEEGEGLVSAVQLREKLVDLLAWERRVPAP